MVTSCMMSTRVMIVKFAVIAGAVLRLYRLNSFTVPSCCFHMTAVC